MYHNYSQIAKTDMVGIMFVKNVPTCIARLVDK